MTSPGGFRLEEHELQASALRRQVLERCRRTLNHDINNAVQSIHSGLELLGKCISAPGALRVSPQECLSLLQQQLVTLRRTLDQLVKDVAEPADPPETFDISTLTSEAVQLLRHERAAAKATTNITPGVKAHASKTDMRTVVLALLLDAIDHLAPEANLEVSVSPGDKQAYIEIRSTRSVADAAETGTRPVIQVVKRMLAHEGAELNVRATNGGTSLSIYVPSPEQSPSVPNSASDAVRVLIADRNRDAADSLAMILQLESVEAKAIYTGTTLAEALAHFAPTVALIDADLPGCEVGAIVGAVREQRGKRPLLAQVSSSERVKIDGFDAYLVRPVEWPQLQGLIARARSRA